MSRWFRHYAGMMRDDKLVRVAIRSKQTIERVVWVWGAILESAAEIDDEGRYDFDAGEAAYFLRADEGDVDSILRGLDDCDRLCEGRVVKWGDRQFQSDRSADRQKRYREKHKGSVTRTDSDGGVTSPERHGDAPETELETETEEEVSNETIVPNDDVSVDEDELALKPEHLTEAWNDGPGNHGAVGAKRMGSKRRRRAVTFLQKYPVDDITEAIAAVGKSDFLCGRTREGFRADIEFLFDETHMNRLLEGYYAR